MYEFLSVISLDDQWINDKYKNPNKLLYQTNDNKLIIDDEYFYLEAFSRLNENEYFFKTGTEYYYLLGEPYTDKELQKGKSDVFCNVKDVINLINSDVKNIELLNGNFIYFKYNIITKECIIISSRLSLNSIYYIVFDNKLFLSTNLSQLINLIGDKCDYDYASLIEEQLFYFPLFDATVIKNIYRVLPAQVIKISHKGIEKNKYKDFRQYYFFEKQDNNIDEFISSFHIVTNSLVKSNEKVNIALTAGFDSRTIFGILKNREDISYQTYAFGLEDAINVKIPLKISSNLSFKFLPVYLSENFEKNFKYWFELTAFLTDGYNGERANYPYAYNLLRDFSKISINGNWGSEAIRPFQNFTSLMSKDMYEILTAKNPVEKFFMIFNRFKEETIFQKSILNDSIDILIERLKKLLDYLKPLDIMNKVHFYMYFENEPKYFANEIQSERIYMTNRYPFYDDDIVSLLFKSSFSGLSKRAFTKNFYTIFESQKVYYEILSKYSPDLLNFETDHGYPPSVFGSKIGEIKLLYGYLIKKVKNILNFSSDFNNHELASKYYENDLNYHLNNSKIKELLIKDHFKRDRYKGYLNQFRLDTINSRIVWDSMCQSNMLPVLNQ